MKKQQTTDTNLDALEEILGYRFHNRSLLEQGITHRSWAYEQVKPGEEGKARRLHNEAFEFIGDSVLGLVVAHYLYQAFPDMSEGALSRMKHSLVSASTIARAAERLCLGQYLRVGRGEEKTGGRGKKALLADVFEAVVAAVFLDGGFIAASRFVDRALDPELKIVDPESAAAGDHKTMLQERLQAERLATPQYNIVETVGPPHHRMFHVEVVWEGGSVRGQGRTVKAAEMEAARTALAHINASP
ncbi:MAG: ribonuclease III [Pyrinomonadaceae bacterium]|nr:ribonuclease III [Pyrinomonadaceae bacterium]